MSRFPFIPRILALVLVPLCPVFAGAEIFMSPSGAFQVDFRIGANAAGTAVKPMTARIKSTSSNAATEVAFQLIRYSDPTTRTVQEAFRFPPGEAAVAIENRLSESKYGFRMVPLRPGLPWSPHNLVAKDLEWIDEYRLVYKGDGDTGYFIGVFDARTGKSRLANSNLSSFTAFRIIDVTPDAVHFRETTSAVNGDVCYSFNTDTGKKTRFRCPG